MTENTITSRQAAASLAAGGWVAARTAVAGAGQRGC
jgi:hypothetical protein